MKLIHKLLLLILSLSANIFAQDYNPYTQFGYQGTMMQSQQEKIKNQHLVLINADTTAKIQSIKFDTKNQIVTYFDKNNVAIGTDSIHSTDMLKFLSVDPLAKDYPNISTYGFAEEDPINFVDLDGLERAYKVPGSTFVIPASDYNRHTPPSNAVYVNRAMLRQPTQIETGATNIALGIAGAVGSTYTIAQSAGVAAPLGGTLALTTSIIQIGLGMSQVGDGIKNPNNPKITDANGIGGMITSKSQNDNIKLAGAVFDVVTGVTPGVVANQGVAKLPILGSAKDLVSSTKTSETILSTASVISDYMTVKDIYATSNDVVDLTKKSIPKYDK